MAKGGSKGGDGKHAKPAGGKHAAPRNPKTPLSKGQPRGFPHDKNKGKGDGAGEGRGPKGDE
jgi:hypothetical protein